MMFRHSLGLEIEAQMIETAVDKVIKDGYRTSDLAYGGQRIVGTDEMANQIISNLL